MRFLLPFLLLAIAVLTALFLFRAGDAERPRDDAGRVDGVDATQPDVEAPPNGPIRASDPERVSLSPGTTAPSGRAPAGAEGSVGSGLSGRVTSMDGRPITGARVEALEEQRSLLTLRTPLGIETATDGAGRFGPLDLAGPLPVALRVSAPGYATTTVGPYAPERAVPIPDVRLDDGFVLAGTVRSDVDLAPVPGARVMVHLDPPRAGLGTGALFAEQSTETDAAGRYHVDGLGYRQYRVEAAADGFAPTSVSRTFLVQRHQKEIELDLALQPATRVLHGVVRTRGDEPLGGARVLARSMGGARDQPAAAATSSADGSFTLTGLADAPYEVSATATGYVLGRPVEVRPGPEAMELVLDECGRIAGRVLAAGGRAAERAIVDLVHLGDGAERTVRSIGTGAGGTFALENVPPGRYRIDAKADGSVAVQGTGFDLDPGESIEDAVVRLGRGGRVRGRVVDDGGRPIADAMIDLFPSDTDRTTPVTESAFLEATARRRSTSASDGTFVLDAVPEGSFVVRVAADARATTWSDAVVVDGSDTATVGDVARGAGATLRGVALDEDGLPLPRARVEARSTDAGHAETAWTAADGTFAMERLPGGRYEITLPIEDPTDVFRYRSRAEADVPAGGDVAVTVRRERRSG